MTVLTASTPCVRAAQVFQDPLLEDGLPGNAGAELRSRAESLMARADALCAGCPIQRACLYEAVVDHDVAGFVAGTTAAERVKIRALLGIEVSPEDLDVLAGVTGPNRLVNHAEVLRLRAANPHESLEMIAMRLGCSLSTVKRHLRKARGSEQTAAEPARPARPTQQAVEVAYEKVCRPERSGRTAA